MSHFLWWPSNFPWHGCTPSCARPLIGGGRGRSLLWAAMNKAAMKASKSSLISMEPAGLQEQPAPFPVTYRPAGKRRPEFPARCVSTAPAAGRLPPRPASPMGTVARRPGSDQRCPDARCPAVDFHSQLPFPPGGTDPLRLPDSPIVLAAARLPRIAILCDPGREKACLLL